MEEWKLAYMAGIVDGEGSISIAKAKKWGNQRHDTYKLVLSVYMSTKEPLDTIVEWFGGKVEVLKIQKERYGQTRPGRQWRANGNAAAYVLELIRPYLLLKWRQADLAIASREYDIEFGGIGSRQPTEEVYEMRETFWDEMHRLNRGEVW